jgi:hypothetical protein
MRDPEAFPAEPFRLRARQPFMGEALKTLFV